MERTHVEECQAMPPIFPLGWFSSANQRFVGARANNFWQYGKHSVRKLKNYWKVRGNTACPPPAMGLSCYIPYEWS